MSIKKNILTHTSSDASSQKEASSLRVRMEGISQRMKNNIPHKKETQPKKTEPKEVVITQEKEEVPAVDEKKRLFMKFAGVAGIGIAASALFPKSAQAYVAGSTPTSNVVGLRDSANTRINPATEGGNLATIAGKDFATEATLAAMKLKTDLLTFDSNNNLQTTSNISGPASVVGVRDKDDVRVTPATDDSILYLRRIVKLMESQATVDSANRQRITLDSLGTTPITTTVPVSGSLTSAGTVSTVTTVTTVSAITTMLGQNHQAFQDVARNAYANGIRNNLNFN